MTDFCFVVRFANEVLRVVADVVARDFDVHLLRS